MSDVLVPVIVACSSTVGRPSFVDVTVVVSSVVSVGAVTWESVGLHSRSSCLLYREFFSVKGTLAICGS